MSHPIGDLADEVRSDYRAGNINRAFERLIDAVEQMSLSSRTIGRISTLPALDELCLLLGSGLRWQPRSQSSSRAVAFLVTTIPVGGDRWKLVHTLLKQTPADRCAIIITGTSVSPPALADIMSFADPRIVVQTAPPGNYATQLNWVYHQINRYDPDNLYVLIEPSDAVAVAALQPTIRGRILYYHENSGVPALGGHVPSATHIDDRGIGYEACRAAGVTGQAFWPRSDGALSSLCPPDRSVMRGGVLNTCYRSEAGDRSRARAPYPYALAYEDVVAETLSATRGRHLHVGRLAEEARVRIETRLLALGLNPDRFVYLPEVGASLERLKGFDVDLFLTPILYTGGLATVQAMAAGLPLVVHSNYRSPLLCDESDVYQEAPTWRTLPELGIALRSFTAADVVRHSRLARRFYERRHRPGVAHLAMRRTFAGRATAPPAPRSCRPGDQYQIYVDEQSDTGACAASGNVGEGGANVVFLGGVNPSGSERPAPLPSAEHARLASLCALYARERLGVREIEADGLFLEPAAFCATVVGRFNAFETRRTRIGVPLFIAYVERPPDHQEPYDPTLTVETLDRFFLADALKAQGFFADAAHLYRSLMDTELARAAALRGLGDLLLLQAGWAREFSAYARDGRALDVRPSRGSSPGSRSWRDHSFDEAIACLRRALAIDPTHPDGIFLLMIGLSRAGHREEARRLLDLYLQERPEVADAHMLRARIVFGIDPVAAATEAAIAEGSSQIAEICSAEQIADVLPTYIRIDAPIMQSMRTLVIQDAAVVACDQSIPFNQSYVAKFDKATVLPRFGMIFAQDQYIIGESLHHREIHYGVFTPAIRVIAERRALVAPIAAEATGIEDAIFIGTNNNYYHWLIDVLPRLRLMELSGELQGRCILVDQAIGAWQLELLRRCGISEDRLVKANFDHAQHFRNLWVPSHLSTLMVAHPEAVAWVRDRILGHAACVRPTSGRRLYVTRRGVPGRTMMNAEAVEERFRHHGFISVDPGSMTISEQITQFRDAEVIAGPGGAGLANAVYAPPGATIICLSASDILCQTFASIAAAIGQRNWFCAARTSLARTYSQWIWTNFDFAPNLADVDLCLDQLDG